MLLGAACAFRRAGHARDLMVLVPLNVVKDEDRARAEGQRCDRALEVYRGENVGRTLRVVSSARRGAKRLLVAFEIGGAHFMSKTSLLAASVAQDQVHGESMNPARKRRLAA